MINRGTPIFYNSMPTWVGNGIALIVNLVITILIYRHQWKVKKKQGASDVKR